MPPYLTGDTMNTKPHLTTWGHGIDTIHITHTTGSDRWDYTLELQPAGLLLVSKEDADALLLILARRLYEDRNLTMDTAERLLLLCNSVLVDESVCGDHGENEPTCDYCERGQCFTPELEWDGETGCHVECQRCTSCGGSGQVGIPADPESCNTCRGTGIAPVDEGLTKDEYDALVADTMTDGE